MKLKRGKPDYKLPAHSQVLSAYLSGNTAEALYDISLYCISADTLDGLRKGASDLVAIPQCYAIVGDDIVFWPAPDGEYTVRGRYCPPIQEF